MHSTKARMNYTRLVKSIPGGLSSLNTKRWLRVGLTNEKETSKGQAEGTSVPHCVYDMCAIRPGTPQPCVVIIGAGMSGLSAASRLVQCGITNFRVLEAMESPGGRLKTCWLGDTVTETGWPYIEGASLANPVYTLAAQDRLLQPPLEREENDEPIILTAEGRPISSNATAKAIAIFNEIESSISEPSMEFAPHKSLAERIEYMIKQKVETIPKFQRWDIMKALYGLMAKIQSKIGQSLKELSPDTLTEMVQLPGGNVRVKGGMTGLVAPLVASLPVGAVVYCKPVNTILWGTAGPGAPRAVVKCCDGEHYPADYVIITVPLGVLKNSGDRMFCPELPAYKMEAIRGLGFGAVNKIFLKYDTPFWAQDSGNILFAWLPNERDEEDSWIKGVTNVDMLPGSKKVIGVTVSGNEATQMETISDTQLAYDLSHLFKKFLGSAVLPTPSEVLKSSWSGNPYFSGYKTYLSRTSEKGMVKSLSKPLPSECEDMPPIIFFAGEHTHPVYFGTLHGSRISGIREADKIINLTKKFGGPPKKAPVCIPCS